MNMSVTFIFKKLSMDQMKIWEEIRLCIEENLKQSFSECQCSMRWTTWGYRAHLSLHINKHKGQLFIL